MPYNSNYVTYLGTDKDTSACYFYGLYIDKCGVSATNNFQVVVNGSYIGDFNGSRNPFEYDYYWPQALPGQEVCPVVTSFGAPEFCDHGDPGNSIYPSLNPGQCGGDISALFMFTSSAPFGSNVFPNGKTQPNGARWPSSNPNSAIITWHDDVVLIGEEILATNVTVPMQYANTVDLYTYFDYYYGSYCTQGSTIPSDTIPGMPACIGIVRYKKIDGYLTCDKFLPLKSYYNNNFTNRLRSTGFKTYGDSFYWWTEASIPVSHDPLPDWVPIKTYYW